MLNVEYHKLFALQVQAIIKLYMSLIHTYSNQNVLRRNIVSGQQHFYLIAACAWKPLVTTTVTHETLS